ncbi:hypothetical protein N9588_03425 [Methylophilaceae bacterium]|nr:hypothetical protein [Methylophilaceae bacterium]
MPTLQEELEKKFGAKRTKKITEKRKPTSPLGVVHKKVKKNENRKPIKCQYCDLDIRADMIRKHCRELHPEQNVKKNNKYIECDICQSRIRSDFLSEHKKKKHQEHIYPDIKSEVTKPRISIKNFNFSLSSVKDFKVPDDWALKEEVTQENKNDVIDIYIGLDFGTSYTKAVIRYSQDSYIVDWSGISNFPNSNTLPSELSIKKNNPNNFNVGRAPDSDIFSNLKIPLLEKRATKEEEDRVVIYLSLVLRYIRQWWHKHDIYPDANLRWNLTIGLPAKDNTHESLHKQYISLTNKAWAMSFKKNNTLKLELNCFSEFAAQMQTYLKNIRRQKDLHLLCDVGGGTVDIVCFNVHLNDKDEDILPTFTSEVEPLGTHYLFQERLKALDTKIQSGKLHDAAQVLSAEEFARKYNANIKSIQDADDRYVEDLSNLIIKVLSRMKSNRYGNSPSWKNRLRVFLCGGAAKTKVVRSAMAKAQVSFKCLGGILFPLPDDIQTGSMDEDDFQRISVAYGLAFDPFSLPKCIDEDKEWHPPTLPPREDYGGDYDK